MSERDWRLKLQATVTENTVLPWSGSEIKKGDQLNLVSLVSLPRGRTLTIPVPDMTALYLSASASSWKNYWAIRTENRIDSRLKNEVSFKDEKTAFDALESLSLSIVSAFSALESFCNDSIPENHEYWHNKKSDLILEKSSKKELERYFSTENKLNEILPSIYSVEKPKGKSPIWVSFKKLKSCRDSLIHVKTDEVRSVGLDRKNLWDRIFVIEKPYVLAGDIFRWYLKGQEKAPLWYKQLPK